MKTFEFNFPLLNINRTSIRLTITINYSFVVDPICIY